MKKSPVPVYSQVEEEYQIEVEVTEVSQVVNLKPPLDVSYKENRHFRLNFLLLKKGNHEVESINNNNVVVVQESFDKRDDGDVLTVYTNSYADAWILDSGASYHMT